MKKYRCLLFLLLIGPGIWAQQNFRPYTAWGIEFNSGVSALAGNGYLFSKPDLGPHLAEWIVLYGLKANYDYAPFKFLGISSGLGVAVRGGKGRFANDPKSFKKERLYYLNVPLKLQLKAGFFWFEPGLQTNLLVGKYEGDYFSDSYFFNKDLKTLYLSYSLIGRFNLFRGLSLHLGLERWLTPTAYIENPSFTLRPSTTYYQLGWVIGARYMFNQPLRNPR